MVRVRGEASGATRPRESGRTRTVAEPLVLILTHPDDLHAHAVQTHLTTGGIEVYRMDTAVVGTDASVVAHLRKGALTGRLGECLLSRVTCVWHRRPSEIPASDALDVAELRVGVGGVLSGLPHLNHPADMAAALKPYQLVTASRCGLSVPETLITTEITDSRAFASRVPVVVKPMSREAGRLAQHGLVHEGDTAGWSRAIHLTQQLIMKKYDVRVTAVDGHMYAARIDSPHLDWRVDTGGCKYEVVKVPTSVHRGIQRLMGKLRLRFGALDFAVDQYNRWWFLEINPNGQWLWIEEATGLPIAHAIALALARMPRYAGGR